jgi:hypothetical protein
MRKSPGKVWEQNIPKHPCRRNKAQALFMTKYEFLKDKLFKAGRGGASL